MAFWNISEQRKIVFVLSRAWDKEKILSPHEQSNLKQTILKFLLWFLYMFELIIRDKSLEEKNDRKILSGFRTQVL